MNHRLLPSQRPVFLAAGFLVLVIVAAYSNSFGGPFVFDDLKAIAGNPTIRQIGAVFCPPQDGTTVAGRPFLNLTLAVNYAVSRLDVWSYHVANLVIHIVTALLLFGILRRTFRQPVMQEHWGPSSVSLSLSIALLWAIHPLQTESVTYVIQRAESLVGMFYLLTLYCFIRGVTAGPPGLWFTGAVCACLLGMATKEVMVTAPLMVFLYDRTFAGGSFREAWRRRRGFYLALAGAWLLLGWLVFSSNQRGGTAGLDSGSGCREYAVTQFGAILQYLKLSVWPHPLVFDYGIETIQDTGEIMMKAAVTGALVAATLVALWRRPRAGFIGAWFFVILAPSSSFIPVATQTLAEHRLYLPLAALLTGLVAGGFWGQQKLVQAGILPLLPARRMGRGLVVCAGVALAFLTFQRNADYRSSLSLWEDTVAKAPRNARAHNNLGASLAEGGRLTEALSRYQLAVEIKPDFADARLNLGSTLANLGRLDEAVAQYRMALARQPDFAEAHYSLGLILMGCGQIDEAFSHYQQTVAINPDFAEAYVNLGAILAYRGKTREAVTQFQKALAIRPDLPEARQGLEAVLRETGDPVVRP